MIVTAVHISIKYKPETNSISVKEGRQLLFSPPMRMAGSGKSTSLRIRVPIFH